MVLPSIANSMDSDNDWGGVITFPGFARFGKQELNRHRKFGLLFHLDAGTLPQ